MSFDTKANKHKNALRNVLQPPSTLISNDQAKAAIEPEVKMNEELAEQITFFTEVDIDRRTGRPRNMYPIYYNGKQVQDIEEEINTLKRAKEKGYADAGRAAEDSKRLRELQYKKEAIEKFEPNFERDKDKIAKLTKTVADILCDQKVLPSRDEMNKRLADPHMEANLMVNPVIPIPKEVQGAIIRNGGRVVKGKCSRDDLSRIYQMGQRALGENPDVEYLRRDSR